MERVGRRFREALDDAATLHENQRRKRGGDDPTWIPYVAQLLGAANLALEVGGSDDEATTAPLHDALVGTVKLLSPGVHARGPLLGARRYGGIGNC